MRRRFRYLFFAATATAYGDLPSGRCRATMQALSLALL
jgi:hypothetical protein